MNLHKVGRKNKNMLDTNRSQLTQTLEQASIRGKHNCAGSNSRMIYSGTFA